MRPENFPGVSRRGLACCERVANSVLNKGACKDKLLPPENVGEHSGLQRLKIRYPVSSYEHSRFR